MTSRNGRTRTLRFSRASAPNTGAGEMRERGSPERKQTARSVALPRDTRKPSPDQRRDTDNDKRRSKDTYAADRDHDNKGRDSGRTGKSDYDRGGKDHSRAPKSTLKQPDPWRPQPRNQAQDSGPKKNVNFGTKNQAYAPKGGVGLGRVAVEKTTSGRSDYYQPPSDTQAYRKKETRDRRDSSEDDRRDRKTDKYKRTDDDYSNES